MYEDVNKLTNEDKQDDIIYSFGLFKVVVFLFIIRFLELTLEVTRYYDFESKIIKDYKDEIITNFFAIGIKEAFNWLK